MRSTEPGTTRTSYLEINTERIDNKKNPLWLKRKKEKLKHSRSDRFTSNVFSSCQKELKPIIKGTCVLMIHRLSVNNFLVEVEFPPDSYQDGLEIRHYLPCDQVRKWWRELWGVPRPVLCIPQSIWRLHSPWSTSLGSAGVASCWYLHTWPSVSL